MIFSIPSVTRTANKMFLLTIIMLIQQSRKAGADQLETGVGHGPTEAELGRGDVDAHAHGRVEVSARDTLLFRFSV